MDKTPRKPPPYVQVPSSSPIYVKSSPGKDDAAALPSLTQPPPLDEKRQKDLEQRRKAIRSHQSWPWVSSQFDYLPESALMKAFVINKGNLREITKYLTENYDKEAILAQKRKEDAHSRKKDEARKQRALDEEAARKQRKQEADARVREAEKAKLFSNYFGEPKKADVEATDDEMSPIKVRARAQTVESPVKSQEKFTTKVELKKPKISILDKYRYGAQQHMLKPDDTKKRKLVRLSSLDKPSDGPMTGMFTKFSLKQDNFTWKKTEGKIVKSSSPPVDELDLLEEKIKANRKKRKKVEDFEEEYSDDMSQDDQEYNTNSGLTSMDDQILEFLNTAEQQDVTEIALIPPKISAELIKKRPFATIYSIADENFETEEEKANKKKKVIRKTLGQKIIETTETSLKGYKAVDSLVKKCSDVGDTISKQMEAWGVTVTGEAELEMVDIEPTNDTIEVEGEDDEEEDDEEGDEDEEVKVVQHKKRTISYIHNKPELVAEDVELKNYQQVGINWLNLMYSNRLSCILADEMGLGKTCQVISFMAHIKEIQPESGPHLVVVPSSTLENWMREFNKFCPSLKVQAYYGNQKEREELRYDLLSQDITYDVMVTTYNLASGSSNDFKFLKNQSFDIIVYDEGHMLKNSNSERYNKLMRLTGIFRILLTGTPLQNNLKELVSLLAFMLPHYFNEKREDLKGIFNQKIGTMQVDENYNPLLSIQAISKAKTMMTPFVLRRKKNQVLKHLPEKVHQTVICQLSDTQQKIYQEHFNKGKAIRQERERRKLLQGKEAEEAKKTPIPSSINTLMALRKAAMHPLLFRYNYTTEDLKKMAKAIMMEPQYADANQQYIFEDMEVLPDYELDNLCNRFPKTLSKWALTDKEYLDSGKITKLAELLSQVIDKGEKVLVFSLFTQMLDILEKVLSILNVKFLRLDGSTSVESRQDIIDQFYEDGSIPVFLLSTRAGGFGINLVAANNVIIFDQSFNPHDDKQAEDRAHRVGQTSKVLVTRLITENSIEENILQLAENKLQLDQSISDEKNDTIIEEKAANSFERLLFGGAN